MSSSSESPSKISTAAPRSPFEATVPLLALTGAFFVATVVVRSEAPHLGPTNFPLWGLLLILGIVAAIGSVFSWFFAVDEDELTEPAVPATTPVAATPRRSAPRELGRPVPEAARAPTPPSPARSAGGVVAPAETSAVEPWNEDSLPPVATRGPRPVLTTLDDPGDIGRALEEIAEIQRQLAVRRPRSAAAGEAPARA